MLRILLSVFVVFLAGCQSSNSLPDWYLEKTAVSDPAYFYAVGQGWTVSQAKKVALNQISAQLWTEVQAKDTLREVVRSNNGETNQQSMVDSTIQSNTAKVAFSDAEVLQQEQVKRQVYMQIRVSKQSIKHQLEKDLNELIRQANASVQDVSNSDVLLWWLKNRSVNALRQEALVKTSMLFAVDPTSNYSLKAVNTLANKVQQVQHQLLIDVPKTPQEPRIQLFLAESLNQQGIKTTSTRTSKVTHQITIHTDLRKSFLSQAYIVTLVSNLAVVNRQKEVLSNKEVIATGNSLSNYQYAAEGASRHFKKQLDTEGVWQILGLEK